MIIVNVQKMKTEAGLNVLFATAASNINVNIGKLKTIESNVLSARLEVVRISENTAKKTDNSNKEV